MEENFTKTTSKYTILVVDDEEAIRNLVVTFLSKLEHLCFTAVDGLDALNKMKENRIDVVVTDVKMPNMDGITLIAKILERYPECPIMVMTAFDEEYSAGTAISVGASEFIRKPFSLDEFAIRLHKMINDSETVRRLKSEKKPDEDVQDLMDELEEVLR